MPAPACVTAAAQKVAAPAAVEEGHARPPDAAAEAVTPAMSPVAPRDEEPDKFKKTDQPTQVSEESWADGESAARERRWQQRAS